MRSRPDRRSVSPPQTHQENFLLHKTPWSSSHPLQVKVLLRQDVSVDLQQERDGHGDAHQRDLHHGSPEEKKNRLNKNSWSKKEPEHRAPPTQQTGQSETGIGSNKVTFHGKVSQCGKIRRVVYLHACECKSLCTLRQNEELHVLSFIPLLLKATKNWMKTPQNLLNESKTKLSFSLILFPFFLRSCISFFLSFALLFSL